MQLLSLTYGRTGHQRMGPTTGQLAYEWQVMEAKLKKSFIDYAKHKRANNE